MSYSLKQNQKEQKQLSNTDLSPALDFIATGIGCNCLSLISQQPFFENLQNKKKIPLSSIDDLKNSRTIYSALLTLSSLKVIEVKKGHFSLSELGIALSKYIGIINTLFIGYNSLMTKQAEAPLKKIKNYLPLLNGTMIAESAIQYGDEWIDPILEEEILSRPFNGSICDLGCGMCTRLMKFCELTGSHGLGIDNDEGVVKEAEKWIKGASNLSVSVECGDISNLSGVWDNVAIAMQNFVFHDFVPDSVCIDILNRSIDNFPNLQYFYYVDIVSPSSFNDQIFPGFDYVHGIMGKTPRSYECTIEMFKESKFKIEKEIPIDGLPNTYIWVLAPKSFN